jgi:hypothetical protein
LFAAHICSHVLDDKATNRPKCIALWAHAV